ncbi:enoyl-CoA hydratase/isomerase family protein [Rhodococcus fascians]|nr:enoyl-CoA hydratase/isomerase family protein [Rhodococcus fascians]MBY4114679.1 enoyl-CoA hydratase/isomerase family protein [Rhodococcus fascians]
MTVGSGDQPVIVSRDGTTTVVTLNRPGAHNALNKQVLNLVHAAIDDADTDLNCRAIVLTGTGVKAFCAGADLREIERLTGRDAFDYMAAGQAVFNAIARAGTPVIAAVNGVALGGGFELVLASTFAVMSRNATLGLPEAGLGLIPGYGGTQRLPRAIGRQSALHLMLTGSRMTADAAFTAGLCAVPPVASNNLMDTALEMAHVIARQGPCAVRSILRAVNDGLDSPLGAGLALESSLAAHAVSSSESVEGIAAFGERRPPVFEP